MKKSLFWSFLAASAIMAGCSDDAALESSTPQLTGEEMPVDFTIDMGGGISTYAIESGSGGWTNYKDDADMQAAYNHRAIIQVFLQSGPDALPISEERRVFTEVPENDKINIENLRLPAGNTYTAVVWVDFIEAETSVTGDDAKRNDLYYNTANLREVTMLKLDDDKMMKLAKTPEGRDAYTGKITFTVAENGTYTYEGQENPQNPGFDPSEDGKLTNTYIPITAKRPFGKVRLVLQDWNNKEQWDMYFKGQNSTEILNYISLTVNDLATSYNALTGKPATPAAGGGEYTFHRAWTTEKLADLANPVNGVAWVEKDGKNYPALDFNYFIPTTVDADDASAYKMSIKTFAFGDAEVTNDMVKNPTDAQLISKRSFASIPVKTNCLTTIWGNFLTAAYNFTVTVEDDFGTLSQTTVKDNNASSDIVDPISIGQARVTRDATGKVLTIDISKIVDKDDPTRDEPIEFTDENWNDWNKMIYEINRLGDISGAAVTIHVKDLPSTIDFREVDAEAEGEFGDFVVVGSIDLQLEGELSQETSIVNIASPLTITNETDQKKRIFVMAANKDEMTEAGIADVATKFNKLSVTIDGANNYNILQIASPIVFVYATGTMEDEVMIQPFKRVVFGQLKEGVRTGATYNETVTVSTDADETTTPSATIEAGTFNKDFDTEINTTVNGGTLSQEMENGVYTYHLQMMGKDAETLTINKETTVFGPLFAEQEVFEHHLVFKDEAVKALYGNGFRGENWTSVTPH